MERLRTDYSLYPTTQDEQATCKAILEQGGGSTLLLMPTHHISQHGDMMGFKYECGASQLGDTLPIVRNMFFGHTAAECQEDDTTIMRLMATPEENKRRMALFMQSLALASQPAELDCIPDNATILTQSGVIQATDLRSVDCKPWIPEVPECIGLYHAYIRGYNRDVRTHRLFIVCSGGCPKAADQFCNLMIDIGAKWTAGEVAESEEAWWLRKTSQRARCRLIKMLADAFGVRVQSVDDVLAHPLTVNPTLIAKAGPEQPRGSDEASDEPLGQTPRQYSRTALTPVLQAVPTTDTIEHDIACRDSRFVTVHNAAVDTTKITNGILCQMHPSEGFWLFRGAPRGTGVYGAMFGSHHACGAFPTRSPLIAGKHQNTVAVQDGSCMVRLESQSGPQQGRGGRYVCFDEAFFKNLERMQWNRDNGYVELIPIVVGMP